MAKCVEHQSRGRPSRAPRRFDCQVIPVDAQNIETADHAFAIYTDVTKRVEGKRALEESEERYRQLVAAAPTPILIYGESEEVVYVNDAALKLFGAESQEAVLGLPPHDCIHPDSRAELDDRRQRLIEGKQAVPPNELPLLDLNGREKTVLVTSSPVTYEGEPAIQTVATDSTELNAREQQLERYETLVEVSGDPMYMLDQAGRFTYVNEALVELSGHSKESLIGEHVRRVMDPDDVERGEEFAGVLSHDLRNPLNVAEGRLDLAMDECESEHLEPVGRGHRRMDQRINDGLSVARAGEAIGETDTVELAEPADASWRNVETETATIRAETRATIQADESRLQQLLENLLRNALDHGGDDVTVTIGDLTDGFYTEDDGPAIPQPERDNVFNPGYSSTESGTGFGLSIVRDIADAHGWDIAVTDGSDGGVRFECTGVQTI